MELKSTRYILLVFACLWSFATPAYSQQPQQVPLTITTAVQPERLAPGDSFQAVVTVDIEKDYYLYAEQTSLTLPDMPEITFDDVESSPSKRKDDPFVGKVQVHENVLTFTIAGTLKESIAPGTTTMSLTLAYQGCLTGKICYLPDEKEIELSLSILAAGEDLPAAASESGPQAAVAADISPEASTESQNPFQRWAKRFGMIGVLLAAFAWGFVTSLTPCVYPMLPIVTASVLGANRSGNVLRSFFLALVYVIGLSLVYAILGVITAWTGGLFGSFVNHPVVLALVAIVFVLLGLSMMDVFFIQMPASIASRLGGQKGTGVIGVLLTGAVSGAIVGPCVGPMLLSLLTFIVALNNRILGFFAMWAFGLGLGMLFLIVGSFSGAAAKLPRAGSWMETLKHIFGVFMFGLALYYIKPLLPGNVFILAVGAFLIGVSVFAGAFDGLSRESSATQRLLKSLGIVLLTLGIAYVAKFALADLFTFPQRPFPAQTTESVATTSTGAEIPWLSDEAEALALAAEQGKPVVIDFWAEWCAACKQLDKEVFQHPDVLAEAEDVIWLKVDCTDSKNPGVKAMLKKYHIVGLPTIIFINAEGEKLWDLSINEAVAPDVFLERLRQIQ